jgi:hypothetical protein
MLPSTARRLRRFAAVDIPQNHCGSIVSSLKSLLGKTPFSSRYSGGFS